MEVKGHLMSTEVKVWKPCKHYNSKSTWSKFHTWHVGWPQSTPVRFHVLRYSCRPDEILQTFRFFIKCYCNWCRSKVIWLQQRPKDKNLVNTITPKVQHGQSSYLVCRYHFSECKNPIVNLIWGQQRLKSENLVNTVILNLYNMVKLHTWHV